MKTVFKNGLIIDGSGKPGFYGTLAVEGEQIVGIGEVQEQGGEEIIDATGLVIAPGFIDTHSHSDLQVLVDPFIEAKIHQGITTEVLGQDGISMAPLPIQYIEPWRKNLAGLDGDSDEIDWLFGTTEGYLRQIETQGTGTNLSYLVPHGNVRMEVVGLENRRATEDEIRRMCAVVRRELEAGAVGLSSGLIYIPCAYSETRELIEMCKVVAEYDGVFVVHHRSEADYILESMEEVLEIGRQSGVKIHFSHLKVCGKKNWDLIERVLSLLEKAQAEGLKISYDQYPYVAGSTMLGVILPPWAHDGGTDKLLERLQDPILRKNMIQDIKNGIPGWDNFIEFAGLDQIYITSVKTAKNQDLIGKNLLEIGEIRGKEPYEAVFDLLLEEKNAVGMVDFYGKEDHVIRFLTRPEQNVCTDGLLSGKPHPRVYGSFPRVLGRYVREMNVLPLEAAVQKMTSKPAEVFGLKKRGTLKVGNDADIVVFDPNTIMDKGTFYDPIQYPVGIEYVMINGRLVLKKGQSERVLAGKVLRRI